MEQIYDMIIIGGGPGGCTAALYAARAGLNTLVIERMSAGGQMALTDIIDNYPGFDIGINGFELGMRMQQGATRFGAKTKYEEVRSVDFSEKIKRIETAERICFAKTVVISTGANPRELGLPNEQRLAGKGIHYCAHCDGRFYKDKTVMVVGGGNSAAQDAIYLSRIAEKVFAVHRRDTLRATKIYHEPLMKAKNVEFIWNSRVVGITEEGRVTGARITNVHSGEEILVPCDGIFISIGRQPVTSFLRDSVALDENGYIIANESTKTNVDGVFAVGDVRTKVLRQVVTAVSDGAVAVHYAEEYIAQNEWL